MNLLPAKVHGILDTNSSKIFLDGAAMFRPWYATLTYDVEARDAHQRRY